MEDKFKILTNFEKFCADKKCTKNEIEEYLKKNHEVNPQEMEKK